MFGIITTAFCLLIFLADVHSSHINNGNPFIEEGNKLFRDENGDTNIKKLVLYKGGFLALSAAIAFVLFFFGAGNFSFLIMVFASFVTLPTAIKNYSLYRKYNK